MLPSTPEITGYKYHERKTNLKTRLGLYATALMLWMSSCIPFPQTTVSPVQSPTPSPQTPLLVGPRADSGSEFSKFQKSVSNIQSTPKPRREKVDKHMCVGEWDENNVFSTTKTIDGKPYSLVVKRYINDEIIATVNGMNPEEALPEGWLIINPEEDCYQLIQVTR